MSVMDDDIDEQDWYTIPYDGFLKASVFINRLMSACSRVQMPTRIIFDYENVVVAWLDEESNEFLQTDIGYGSSDIGYINVILTLLDDTSERFVRKTERLSMTLTPTGDGIQVLLQVLEACRAGDQEKLRSILHECNGSR